MKFVKALLGLSIFGLMYSCDNKKQAFDSIKPVVQ